MDASDPESLALDLGLPQLGPTLTRALEQCVDPVGAPERVAEVLRHAHAADAERLRQLWQTRAAELLHVTVSLCAGAPFFAPLLCRYPHWLCELAQEDLGAARSREQLEQRLDAALRQRQSADLREALRRFKYYELARISVRDLSLELVPYAESGATLLEISHLADALLSRSLEVAADELAAQLGPPRWTLPDGTLYEPPFVVLGLGKLGSQALNYSSDVDLVYVYATAGDDAAGIDAVFVGERELAPAQYFTRLAQEFGRIVSAQSLDGFLYRIDLALRPEGHAGALVVPSDTFTAYYDGWAASWERAACMKARPVAGNLGFGWQVLRRLDPILYRSAMDFEAVAAIRTLKEAVEEAKGRVGTAFNVKLGAGGIRDVESVAQALLLLHGGRIPQLRHRSTQATLDALNEVGVLSKSDSEELLEAYRFYRRLENRLQMVAERQTHTLPTAADELDRLARSLGCSSQPPRLELADTIDVYRQRCRDHFARVFSTAGAERVIALLERWVPDLLGNPVTRPLYEELARHFSNAIDSCANPERATNNLDRFVAGLRGRRFYFELLVDRPELVDRLASLFAASEYLSSFFAANPRLIEPIFNDPTTLLLSRAQLEGEFDVLLHAASQGGRDPTEVYLESLRLFHHRQLVNIGLLDLGNEVTRAEIEGALTDLAEVCLDRGLVLGRTQLEHRISRPPEARFLVVGMGKLGSRELTYGSDLDVIFLYEVPGGDEYAATAAQEYHARLAQKLIWALSTRVVTGVCYEVDARLRPSGRQGTLVTSLAGFRAYHARSAQIWERQALLRARPVAGDRQLAESFERLRQQILLAPLEADPALEIRRVRQRMQGELARETEQRRDFKTGHGGLLDVESVIQLLQLRHAARYPQVLRPDSIAVQIASMRQLGLLSIEDSAILTAGWEFLQRLSSRLRVVENRSISDLDAERGDLDALAITLGYSSPQRSGGARRALLADYMRHTNAIRGVYDRICTGAG